MEVLYEGATSFSDLPLAPEGKSWDGASARKRIAAWASSDGSGSKATMDWPKYRKGFLWYDDSSPDEFGSYKLPFADVVGGVLKVVWNGVSAALSRLPGTNIPDADKQSVQRHVKRYYQKFGKVFPEDAMDQQTDALREMLRESYDLVECEEAYLELARLLDGESDGGLAEAEAKIDELKQQGREQIEDSFTGSCEIVESLADGRLRVRAIVAQVDTVNRNKRLYPKAEMVKALERANRLAKRGSIVALADHPGIFSDGGVRDIVVRWERFMLKDKDIHAEGTTVLTEAGRDVTTVWQSGIALEWSTRGYGRREEVTSEKGKFLHDEVVDYIMEGVDVVLRGAAKTRTLSLEIENTQRPELAEENTIMDDKHRKPDDVEETVEDVETTPKADETPEPKASEIDMNALAAKVAEMVQAGAGNVADTINQVVAERMVEAKLESYKEKRLGEVVLDEASRKPLERAVERAATTEDVDEVFEGFQPMLEAMVAPKPSYSGIGIVTEHSRQRTQEDNWLLGETVCERPDSPEDARRVVLEAFIGSLPVADQAMIPGTKAFTFAAAMDNLWENNRQAFTLATKDGARQARLFETATTTATMGTVQPLILPMLYSLWPKLIPFEIASVQPLSGPSGVIHSLAIQDAGTNNDLSDSSNFDSTFADHTEAATKAQIKPVITQLTVTTYEKAIYYDVTSALRQDVRNVHGIDLDSLMISEATNQIAREINLSFLDMMLQGATAGTQTYGTQVPAAPTYNTQEWNNRLGAFVIRAKTMVQEKVYETPNWVVAGPGAAGVLQSMNAGGVQIGEAIEFGSGLQYIGIMGNSIRVYEATWFSRNDMLFGFRPPTWSHTGAVYAPYIPLYVSPEDYTASTNTYARSVATRMAMKLTNGDCYSRITISNAAGTDISAW